MKRLSGRLILAALAALTLAAVALPAGAEQSGDSGPHVAQATDETVGAAADKVLILGNTVSGGAASHEAQAAVALGFTVDVVTNATWSTMTTGDFSAYRAIVIGDPTCSSASAWAAADANPGVWSPAVTGNVIVIGTDPVFHYSGTGAGTLINKAMAFVTAVPGRTGFYADTSCETFGGPAPLLNSIEPGWTGTGVGCADNIHIVATNPFILGLTDADLSGWSCSVHAAFTTWPADFTPIAIDTDVSDPKYTASDGTKGTPYILGRGEGLSSTNILLSPDTTVVDLGGSATLTALVQFGGTPLAGTTVTFTVISGVNVGFSGTAVTDPNGVATFVYTSALPGVDTFAATFVNPNSVTETSNEVTVTWTGEVVEVSPRLTG